MTTHPFDLALALNAQGDGRFLGATSPAYANMVGPFGGVTAAQVLNAILQHPERLGDPVALTVNYAAALSDGAFSIVARAARTNRSTQHWVLEMVQGDHTVMTGTAVTAVRRETWGMAEVTMPTVKAPAEVPPQVRVVPVEWIKRYDVRLVGGPLPDGWDGRDSGSSLSQMWMRDAEPRPLDFCSLTALADVFFPRVYVRRAQRVPIGTVSMTVYFHAGNLQFHATGTGFVLGQAQGQVFHNGFFDQTAQLWNEAGTLLATSHQVVYFKE